VPGCVQQINISRGGVPKLPIQQAVVTALGIEGDGHAHPEIHGGPKKALLWICGEAIEELKDLGYPLYAGALGENLTSRGVDRRGLRIGQRWRAGGVVMELTKVRAPCRTIQVYGPDIGQAVYDQSVQSGDWSSPRWGLSGFYAAVVQPGPIRPGDSLVLLEDAFIEPVLDPVV
jgi:MOSC domain-containing protein YiiM